MPTSRLISSVANTTAHRDRDDLDISIARLLAEFIHAKSVAIYRLQDDGKVVRVARRIAVLRGQDELGRDDLGDVTQLPTLDTYAHWRECVDHVRVVEHVAIDGSVRSLFPIENETQVVGLMDVEPRRPLRAREVELISAILQIVKNHLTLLDYGEYDTLTNLMNRKTFESSFAKLRSRMEKHAPASVSDKSTDTTAESSWLGVVDIDNFKAINDTFGHLFGDEVLLLVAGLMKQTYRGADQLFRFGGEEFVIVLDRAAEIGASIAFERLRTSIESYAFPQVGKVTISLGYTRVDSQDSASDCVERADAALYYAKHHGRNNIRNYETLVAAGEIKPAEKKTDDIELF